MFIKLFILSLLGITSYHWLLFKAIDSSISLNNSLISATTPIITLTIGAVFFCVLTLFPLFIIRPISRFQEVPISAWYILKKLLLIAVEDHFKEFNLLLSKSIYTDEEFFIKYLEKSKKITNCTSHQLSKRLNINLRTLQRIIRKLIDAKVIKKCRNNIILIDKDKLEEYKERFKK